MFNRSQADHQVTTRRAQWGEAVLADSVQTQLVDGYEYFPPEAVNWDHLQPSLATSMCHWKGRAHYFDVVVDDRCLAQAAWTYPDPYPPLTTSGATSPSGVGSK